MIWVLIPFIWGVVWIIWNAACLPKMKGHAHTASFSILIPLRNESARVDTLMQHLMKIRYPKVAFLLYDDASTDDTYAKLQSYIAKEPRLTIKQGTSLPEGWRGKPHACQQLSKQATGDILLFIDADVALAPETLYQLDATFTRTKADAISGFARFQNESVLEKLLTPLLHFFIYFHLPIILANRRQMVAATAASGAFIAVKRTVYEAIGGHAAVKADIVEDVALFRVIKRQRYRAILCHVADDVRCAMYGSSKATWRGFQKNCFQAFGESYVFGIGVCLFYSSYFVLPLACAIYSVATQQWIWAVPFLCITLQRCISDVHARQFSLYSLLMPISALIYVALLIYTMTYKKRNKKTYWKGRAL